MTLFADDDDFREFLSVNVGFTVDNLKHEINDALNRFILPFCSKAQFNISVAETTEPHLEFIRLVKYAAANLGMYLYMPTAKVSISNSGIEYVNDKNKQASAEDKQDFALSLKAKGLAGIEQLLAHLEEYETDFATWKASPSYTKFTSILIRSSTEFAIIDDSRHVFLRLFPYIEEVEFNIIRNAIPKAVLTKLYSRTFGTDPDTKAVYNELLTKYAQVVVRNFALAQAINAFAVVKDKYNTLTVFDDTTANKSTGHKDAPVNKLDKWRQDLLDTGSERLKMMNLFIQENAEALGITLQSKSPKVLPFRNDETHGTAFF